MAEMSASDYAHWRVESDEKGLVWLGLDQSGSGTNTLGSAVLEELERILQSLAPEPPRGLIVYSRKPGGFAAGADVKEFTRLRDEDQAFELVRRGQTVFERLASLPCPTVAMIHGFALGGGLELALACRYRIAADAADTRLGLPEVKLGIHPGFGGTVRSVALMGVTSAMSMMLTGRSLGARKALAAGLVDKLARPSELRARATNLALTPPRAHKPPLLQRILGLAPLRPVVAIELRRGVARRVRESQYPAPYALVSLWRKHGGRVRPESFAAEARSMARLACTDTARNLLRVFLLQTRLKGLGRKGRFPLRQVHVIGAGTMGGDIAAWCAYRGVQVTLQDRSAELVEPAIERAHRFFERRLHDPAAISAAAARLRMDLTGEAVGDADVVIEAIFENREAKAALFARIESKLGEQALLATNTSSIPLEDLAAALRDPARLVGLHFFNPVAKMPLVEVVTSAATPVQVAERARAVVGSIGKLPLPVRSSPGFLVNRILAPYLMAGLRAWSEGLPLAVIDRAAEDFGMPIGPAELADTVGLDVALSVAEVLHGVLRLEPPGPVRDLVAAGRLGRKSGHGLYEWSDGRPKRHGHGARRAPADLADRLMLPLLNEAVRCLRERVVADSDLVDAGAVFGTGFAPFRGGPLHYARSRGPAQLRVRLEELAARYGAAYQPDAGWDSL